MPVPPGAASAPTPNPYAARRAPLTERELNDFIRSPFAIDCDRILYSKAYSRYIDKTQVFYLVKNDHITHRVLHVQLVSRIARTIGQKLGLDLDFIEAASLGHDLGHPPFGHDGEQFLGELAEEAGIGPFRHASMSLRFLEKLERGGLGLNLTLGVLDAILCHDGESSLVSLSPSVGPATFRELDRRRDARLAPTESAAIPMTREGCVVRLSDSISYVGRDLEDAILLGLVKRSEIPPLVAQTLGSTCGSIVYRLVADLLETSQNEESRVAFSPPVGEAINVLKDFNRERVYFNPVVKRDRDKIKRAYRVIFETFAADFRRPEGPGDSRLGHFLQNMSDAYRVETTPEEKARDFIAGMTDDYFLRAAEDILMPSWSAGF
ncbi:MAG: HD domain-containing protein [Deltaproteobacteria bacterium]|jgi:dGTPase|nr:HD domain-containing protein [Deltaproteobacteria bacterium]